MPDTGAPWNIPYVESTDLVSDWPADSLALANAIDAGLDAAGNAGIGSNVVNTTKTSIFATSSGTYVDVTGLNLTITPTSASSKVLIIAQIMMTNDSGASGNNAQAQLVRNSTAITELGIVNGAVDLGYGWDTYSVTYIDSPATTSATTYKVQVKTAATCYVNRRKFDATAGSVSSLTAIEVAA